MEKSTFVIDVDGTVCKASLQEDGSYDYENAKPIQAVIDRINQLHREGHTIILFTSRGMKTHNGDLDAIYENVAPVLEGWLAKHKVRFHRLIMGKPWGPNVYYVDDRSLSPFEFTYQRGYDDIIRKNTLTL